MSKSIKLGLQSEWIPNSVYHAGPGASNSDLALLYKKSPAHLRWKKEHPDDPTDSMKVGQAFHTLVLEPEHFHRRFAILGEDVNLRTKAGRAERDDLEASGKIVLREAWLEDVQNMVKSVKDHPAAGALLDRIDGTVFERPIYYEEPTTGMLCKIKPDIQIHNDRLRVIVDLKKTRDANRRDFRKSIGNYLYHQQAAMYLDGAKHGTGKEYDAFIFIAVEDYPPYACAVWMCDAEMIHIGHELYLHNLRTFQQCLNRNEWPAYSPDVTPIELPPWLLNHNI